MNWVFNEDLSSLLEEWQFQSAYSDSVGICQISEKSFRGCFSESFANAEGYSCEVVSYNWQRRGSIRVVDSHGRKDLC